ncbi:MAG TPA: hypothetical protein VM390_08605 [Acidimicrobiales bacterium]|nr:hypothetical protein [Acidimicrobiales bacterium]
MAPAPPQDDLLERARDAAYTAVGFGVLAFQRLQVERRQLAKDLSAAVGGRAGARRMARQLDDAVDPVLDRVEERLPDDARRLLRQARVASRALQETLLR